MLTTRTSEMPELPPDTEMAGRCLSCGTMVHALRQSCEWRTVPGWGKQLCCGCPKVMYTNRNGEAVACGAAVEMHKARED